jgi:hypothetical protein
VRRLRRLASRLRVERHVRHLPALNETRYRLLETSVDVILESLGAPRVWGEVLLDPAIDDEIGERRRLALCGRERRIGQRLARRWHLALGDHERRVEELFAHLACSQLFGSLTSPPLNFILPCLKS